MKLNIDEDLSNVELDGYSSLQSVLEAKPINEEYGYSYIFWSGHPNASASGKVFLHRHLAAVARGKWLVRGEIVTFLDGNKKNIQAHNIRVMTRSSFALSRPQGGPRQKLVCAQCENEFDESYAHSHRRVTCSPSCSTLYRRKFDPDPKELEELVWDMPTTKVAILFGVSDVAVSKRCKLFNIKKPPRGYWARVNAGHIPDSPDLGLNKQ